MKNVPIIINDIGLHETIQEMTSEMPFMITVRDLHNYRENKISWQWHPEVELFYMLEGRMEYRTARGIYVFEKGDAGFVNSELLHFTGCNEEDTCKQKAFIFMPHFIGGIPGSAIDKKYVSPVTDEKRIDILKFPAGSQFAKDIIAMMQDIETVFTERDFAYEIKTREKLAYLWLELMNVVRVAPKKPEIHCADEQRIKQMLGLIKENYGGKIEVKDIAEAGEISESECTRCFNRQLGQAPYEYLLDYRIEMACDMLSDFKDSLKDVASACGFGNYGNFLKAFKEKTGMTPGEYRAKV